MSIFQKNWRRSKNWKGQATKEDIANDVKVSLNISKRKADLLVNLFFHILEREIFEAKKVKLEPLGTFYIRRPNIGTGHDMYRHCQIPLDPDNLVVKFRPETTTYFTVE